MWKRLTTALMAAALLATSAVQADTLTVPEAAKLLSPSVFSFGTNRDTFCTATKIGPREYLTALHCAYDLETNWRLESVDGEYAFIRSVLASVSEKTDERREDWAILIASSENDAPAMMLGCGDPHWVGEPVAYMGFPEGLERAFGAGYISTMKKGSRNNADIFVDLPVAPGASGAAVISLTNGYIMGVLTEGVLNTRTTEFYMTGVETIESTDQCEDWASSMKIWDAMGEDTDFLPSIDDKGEVKDDWVDWT